MPAFKPSDVDVLEDLDPHQYAMHANEQPEGPPRISTSAQMEVDSTVIIGGASIRRVGLDEQEYVPEEPQYYEEEPYQEDMSFLEEPPPEEDTSPEGLKLSR